MNDQRKNSDKQENTEEHEDTGIEKLARIIDPPSREISDDELKDPGGHAARVNPQPSSKKPPQVR